MHNIDRQNARNLIVAARQGDIVAVHMLLRAGTNINSRDRAGRTALHHAISTHNLDVANLLLANLADPNIQDNEGDTPLHVAINEDLSLQFIERLINKGASTDIENFDGEYPIHYLPINVDDFAQKLEVLLRAGAHTEQEDRDGNTYLNSKFNSEYFGEEAINNLNLLLNARANIYTANIDGNTILHTAASPSDNAYTDFKVDYLIEHGVNIEARNNNQETPLLYAALNNKDKGFFHLVEKGADITALDNKNNTALHCAVLGNSLEIVRFLVENHPRMINIRNAEDLTPLQLAREEVNEGNEINPLIFQTLEEAERINLRDANGMTALHHAAANREIDKVRFLLNNRAIPDIQDNNGMTPLHYNISERPSLQIVQSLIDNGADVNIAADMIKHDGYYPIHYLSIGDDKEEFLEILEILIQAEADINQKNGNHETLLSRIFYEDTLDETCRAVLDYMIENLGADLNVVDDDNNTILHKSTAYNLTEPDQYNNFKLDYLIRRGLNIEAKNKDGETPLLYAASNGYTLSFNRLLKLNANVKAKDKEGNTALHCAVLGNSVEIVKFLVTKYPKMIGMRNKDGLTPSQLAMEEAGNGEEIDQEIFQILQSRRGFAERENARGNSSQRGERF